MITTTGSFLTKHILSLDGRYGGHAQPSRPVAGAPPPELLRCMICGRVSPRATVEYRRGYCEGGHMGQWRLVAIILSFCETNKWTPSCLVTVGGHNINEDDHITRYSKVTTVLTWRTCIPRVARHTGVAPLCSDLYLCCIATRILFIAVQDCKLRKLCSVEIPSQKSCK